MSERPLEYESWIDSQRKFRATLLLTSPVVRKSGNCLICLKCKEVLLCHEETCPNCNGKEISEARLGDIENEIRSGERIRCRYRFEHL